MQRSECFDFSDSLSALQSLESSKNDIHTNQYILQIKLKYQPFMENNPRNKLLFYWIPAHLGIEGNECVNQAAKRATEKKCPNYPLIPYNDLVDSLKKLSFSNTVRTIREQGRKKVRNISKFIKPQMSSHGSTK